MHAPLSRRQMLHQAGCGFASLAFSALATEAARGSTHPHAPQRPHHMPRAKRVIFLFMHGGPSHVDTFDYKPKLQADSGKQLPFEMPKNLSAKPTLLGSPWQFARQGKSGLWVSELFPHMARHVDDLCVIRSMHSRGQSHGQAVSMLHTGSDVFVRPSVGAWISYGLGTENRDLPSFVSIAPPTTHGGSRNYGSAFLPAAHQATTIGSAGRLGSATIENLTGALKREDQRAQLDLLQAFNQSHLERAGQDAQIEGAIESFELAYRMQGVAPEVLDLSNEPRHVLEAYGVGEKATDGYARECLMARRLAEAGVRYIQVSTGNVWDQHGNLKKGHEANALAVDRPIAALLDDLKQRGMLEDTLVVWGGEFGRTPVVQGSDGRDHNPQGFTMWMAGAGVRGGLAYGETDAYGYYAVQDKVHMHDLHATVLHLMGMDHLRLTYRYAGRDFRLTDIHGEVIHGLLA